MLVDSSVLDPGPAAEALIAGLPEPCVIDGEIVIATETGLDFDQLQLRLHPAASRVAKLAADTPASFVAFDALASGVEDLRERSQRERRQRPEQLLRHVKPPIHLTPMAAHELAQLRERGIEDHPWRDWADAGDATLTRMPGGQSRSSAGKDLSWEPLRIERLCEVKYGHMQGDRFRHAAVFLRWRADKPPRDCRYDQLEVHHALRAGKRVQGARHASLIRRRLSQCV